MRQLTTALLISLLAASAQQAPQTPTTGTARFGATSQLVVEDVIVRGKDGNPVTNLKASDFTITEDGKPQKISVFEFQKLEEQPSAPLAPGPDTGKEPSVLSERISVPSVTANAIAPETPGDLR